MTRGELLALAQAIDDFDESDAGDTMRRTKELPCCMKCGGEYVVAFANDPTPLDDQCAHEMVVELARALLREVARNVAREMSP